MKKDDRLLLSSALWA